MSKINYQLTPEFQKDFKRLLKSYKTLEADLELAKAAVIELLHVQKINNLSSFPMPGYWSAERQICKIKKFTCRSMKGKGVKSGIRVIYAYYPADLRVEFIEIYYIGEKASEDSDRLRHYLRAIL